MNVNEIIKILCIKRGITIAQLSVKLGNSKQNLFNKIYRNNMKLSDLEKILSLLNAEIVILDKETGKPFSL